MNLEHGIFTVSLDFELYWGVRDKRSIEQYKDNLQGVRKAVPELLRIFDNGNIHATWATVGFLFFKDAEDLNQNLPKLLPTYKRKKLSPHKYIYDNAFGLDPIYHFAPELIKLIHGTDGQEIGTHTLSHYYCLEDGQSIDQFMEDVRTAIKVAKRNGISIKSFVFPRNQWNEKYLSSLVKLGVRCYRGNESNWIYKASDDKGQNKFQRAFRLVDAYLNLSGHNTYDLSDCEQGKPFNIPSSRFLRPYSHKLSFLDEFRLRRIKNAMNHAAANNKVFHLWWHPHNFGINTKQNINFLEKILEHYSVLNKNHGMKSLNMGELCQIIEVNNE